MAGEVGVLYGSNKKLFLSAVSVLFALSVGAILPVGTSNGHSRPNHACCWFGGGYPEVKSISTTSKNGFDYFS